MRRAIASALGNFRDPKAAAALRGYLEGSGRNPGDASYYVQANAATALYPTVIALMCPSGRARERALILGAAGS